MKKLLAILMAFAMVCMAVPLQASPYTAHEHDVVDKSQPQSPHGYYKMVTGQPREIGTDAYAPDPPGGTAEFHCIVYIPVWYRQTDSRWAADIMQYAGEPIGTKGCALTSATMVFCYWGAWYDPKTFNTTVGDYADPLYWAGVAQRAGQGKVGTSPYVYFGKSFTTGDWYDLAYAISRGKAPIIEITKPSGGHHWVVVYSVDGYWYDPSSYMIVDPADGLSHPLTYYTSWGCYPSSLIIYNP